MSQALPRVSSNDEEINQDSIKQLEASLNNLLPIAGLIRKALFRLNDRLVLVLDDDGSDTIEAASKDISAPGTPLQIIKCNSRTGCVDVKTGKPVPHASVDLQTNNCLRNSLQQAGATISELLELNNELVMVVDDGNQNGARDATIREAIRNCPSLGNKPLRVIRCSQGTGGSI